MSTRTQEEKSNHIIEQKKIMESLKVGLRDPNKDEITKIYAVHTEFVIYEIKTPHLPESLRTYINTLDQDDKEISSRYTSIRKLVSEAKINMFKAIDPIVYKVSLAHCISHALHGGQDADKQIKDLIEYVNNEYKRQFNHRARYLTTVGLVVLFNITVSIFSYITGYFSGLKQIDLFIFVGTAGSIGGFVSVSRRLKDTIFERDVKGIIFIMYAIERIMVATFAAMVVLFAVKSNLIFGMLTNKIQNPLYGYVVFGVLAGFSETFLPNLLIKLENKA